MPTQISKPNLYQQSPFEDIITSICSYKVLIQSYLLKNSGSRSLNLSTTKKPSMSDYPDENCILTQVRYLGVLQTIFIRKNTFPHRRTYSDFRKVYCIAFKSLYKEGNDR
jgi:hypothetical protein